MIEETPAQEIARLEQEMKAHEVGSVAHNKLRIRKNQLEDSLELANIPVANHGSTCLSCEG